MNFFLISGPPNSGKTTQIHRLFNYYKQNGWSVKEYIQRANNDFQGVLENDNDKRIILFHSDTDIKVCIDDLLLYSQRHSNAVVIITSCRNEPDPMRNLLFQIMKIQSSGNYHCEVSVGRMPSGSNRPISINWYSDSIEKTATKIGSLPPFNL